MGSESPAAMQSVIQQRDLLQSGLLSTCRERSRIAAVSHTLLSATPALSLVSDYWSFLAALFPLFVIHKVYPMSNQELELSWREYEKLEGDVALAKNDLLEQLEALGSPQV